MNDKQKILKLLTSKDINKMLESEFDLTIFTCDTEGKNRITLRANRIECRYIVSTFLYTQ